MDMNPMNLTLAREVNSSLRTLGLEPGATAADVRSAFRRLARVCHPDVAGRREAWRFQQIAGAYSLLKGLTPEDLKHLTVGASWVRAPREAPRRRQNSSLMDWYRRRRERTLDGGNEPDETGEAAPSEAKDQEAERGEREEARQREERVDRVLDQYERSLTRRLESIERSADQGLAQDILSRLESSVPEVRRLALGRMGALANRGEFRQALAGLLRRWEVDEDTGRLVAGLPLQPDALRRLAEDVADRAGAFPNSLVASLLGLRDPEAVPDPSLMERYLTAGSPEGLALILRYWPAGSVPSDATLHRLLESEDPQVLTPVLSAMKQRFPEIAPRHRKRLIELQQHPEPAVRVWGRVLSAM